MIEILNANSEILKLITTSNLVYLNNKTIKDKRKTPEINDGIVDFTDVEVISWEKKTKTLHLKI